MKEFWKSFDFGEDMDKNVVARFLAHPVYTTYM